MNAKTKFKCSKCGKILEVCAILNRISNHQPWYFSHQPKGWMLANNDNDLVCKKCAKEILKSINNMITGKTK